MLGKTHIALALGLGAGSLCLAQGAFSALDMLAGLLGQKAVTNPFALSTAQSAIFYAALAFGALLPDIDEPQSTLGRRTMGLSNALKALFGHRGFTHSFAFIGILGVLFALLAAFVSGEMLAKITAMLPLFKGYLREFGGSIGTLNSAATLAGSGILLGCLFHLVGDALTKSGVPLLLPFSARSFHLLPAKLRFKTGGIFDYATGAVGLAVFAAINAKSLNLF